VRAQIDLIDYQSMPDDPFNYVLAYQDHVINFANCVHGHRGNTVLWLLSSSKNSAFLDHLPSSKLIVERSSVMGQLNLVMCKFVKRSVHFFIPIKVKEYLSHYKFGDLSCCAGSIQFCTGVIAEIKKLWPGTVLVTGKPHHSESKSGIERSNRTIEEKIKNWMYDNKSTHRAQSIPFIQWSYNTQIHRGIGGQTPYHLMFGQHPQVGISNLPIAPNFFIEFGHRNGCLSMFGSPTGYSS